MSRLRTEAGVSGVSQLSVKKQILTLLTIMISSKCKYDDEMNNKDLTSVSSSKDGVRDVPAAYITTNRFTQNDLKRYKTEEKNEVQNGASPVIR